LLRNKGQIPYDLVQLHQDTIWSTLAGHPLSFCRLHNLLLEEAQSTVATLILHTPVKDTRQS